MRAVALAIRGLLSQALHLIAYRAVICHVIIIIINDVTYDSISLFWSLVIIHHAC